MKKGFTLIELLIVVAIIAILAAIAVPNFLEAQVRAKVSRQKNDMRAMATALESYAVDHNRYPPDGQEPPGRVMTYFGSTFGAPPSYYGSARLNNMITTPIAYVTTADFGDVFAPPKAPYINSTLRYVNFKDTYGQSSIQARRNVYPAYLRYCGNWQLTSMGPDRTATPSDPAYGLFWTVMRYDPTNGTVSRGDIIRSQANTEGYAPK